MPRLACLLMFVSMSAINVGGCGSSKTNGDAAAGAGGAGAVGEGGGAGQAEGGRVGGGQAGTGGGQGGGSGGTGEPIHAGACRTQGQTCSATEHCCVPFIRAGGCVMSPSDRNLKRDLVPVDGERILDSLAELPITTWRPTALVMNMAVASIGSAT